MNSQIKSDYVDESSSVGITNFSWDKVKQEQLSAQGLETSNAYVKSQTFTFSIKQEQDDIDIKLESLSNDEVDIKSENIETSTSDQTFIQCVICDDQFLLKDNLNKEHLQIHKHKGIAFVCEACNTRLMQHNARLHNEETPYQCKACNKTFARANLLTQHLKMHLKLHECQVCNQRYSSKSNLMSHSRGHTGERPYECHFCSKKFIAYSLLTRHINTHLRHHTVKPYKCRVCNERFTLKSSLNMHLVTHIWKEQVECVELP